MFTLNFDQCISIVKRETNSTIEQKNSKDHEKRDRLLSSKMEIYNLIFSEIKVLPSDPVFSIWANFNKKESFINCSKERKKERINFSGQSLHKFSNSSLLVIIKIRLGEDRQRGHMAHKRQP